MRSIHLTLAFFCHLLLASMVFYFMSFTATGSPLFSEHQVDISAAALPKLKQTQQTKQVDQPVNSAPNPPEPVSSPEAAKNAVEQKSAAQPVQNNKPSDKPVGERSGADSPLDARSSQASIVVPAAYSVSNVQKDSIETPADPAKVKLTYAQVLKLGQISDEKTEVVSKVDNKQPPASFTERKKTPESQQEHADGRALPSSLGFKQQEFAGKSAAESILTKKDADTVQPSSGEHAKRPRKEVEVGLSAPTSPLDTQQAAVKLQPEVKQERVVPVEVPQSATLVAEPVSAQSAKVETVARSGVEAAPSSVSVKGPEPAKPSAVDHSSHQQPARAAPAPAEMQPASPVAGASREPAKSPLVMGGLGPLHLLATTLCSYQPDKPVADENLNQLYARRASVRKSLFDFMSLKFTNLEKLSSRLGYGLQVVPAVAKSPDEDSKGLMPSHGWPVVGKCTAYDLKLMGEAAWCECQESDNCQHQAESVGAQVQQQQPLVTTSVVDENSKTEADDKPAPITSNQHAASQRAMSARSIGGDGPSGAVYSLLPSPEESSVISKILHVTDIKNAPLVESSIYNLNLTQHQLATLEAHATSTQECRRNALRYSKALFNHLAEDQRSVSESWPKLYAAISADDCARKRVIDIVNALSSFRTDTTSIRRDNLEFAFAMDDLRAKVLENEVNVPLTFDRHFIEVEQFLQQSVRLMLANIQPKRAKLTSMRYRSLMYGSSSDEQCIDLHQRLLARNYPNDCNPTHFGQLPDVLRMTASSLELWSIEKELSMRMAKVVDYPNESPAGQQKVKEDVNECIANLVSS